MHGPVVHPVKVDPGSGLTVSLTVLPVANSATQLDPQSMPFGLLAMRPDPVPVFCIVKRETFRGGLNVAVTVRFPSMFTLHAPMPLQAPPQPSKVEPLLGVAVKSTLAPMTKFAVQVAAQDAIPVGSLLTVPSPKPSLMTVRVAKVEAAANVAVTVRSAPIATIQAPVPLHPLPVHPMNADPLVGVALSVTVLPVSKTVVQTLPQKIPLGSLVTMPVPDPPLFTVSRFVAAGTMNRAVTVAFACTAQGPVPEQAPPQPANAEPGAAAAFKDTFVPCGNWLSHVDPQSMPAGSDVTVPLPAPSFATVTVKSRTSVISRFTGAPAIRFTFGSVPPNILAFATSNAVTAIVRLGPTGASIVTGISFPLVGSVT